MLFHLRQELLDLALARQEHRDDDHGAAGRRHLVREIQLGQHGGRHDTGQQRGHQRVCHAQKRDECQQEHCRQPGTRPDFARVEADANQKKRGQTKNCPEIERGGTAAKGAAQTAQQGCAIAERGL